MFEKLRQFNKQEFRGTLITFDGVDGSGKSTMIEMLEEKLKFDGKKVTVTTQPTPEMRELSIFKTYIYQPDKRHLVDYQALQLFMLADRLQHVKEVIEPALKEGKYVISDRYIFTMLATMVARGHRAEPWLDDLLPHIPLPHVPFIMDVDLDTCVSRIKERKSFEDSFVEREHLRKSLNSYREVASHYKLNIISSSSLNVQEAFEEVLSVINKQ
jgi:dTMP kinase